MTTVYLVLGCRIDLTDPEPNVWVNNIFSTQEKAEKMVEELKKESTETYWGWFEREVDSDNSYIRLDKKDVDMERFC